MKAGDDGSTKGWARDAQWLSARTCRAVCGRIRETFRRMSIELGVLALADDLNEIDWLGNLSEPLAEYAPRDEAERARYANAFRMTVRARRIERAFVRCESAPGFAGLLRHLRRLKLVGQGGERSQAWDLLFEVELAAQFLAAGVWVEFSEPDLLVSESSGSTPDERMAVACKRPTDREACVRQARAAVAQIHSSGFPGLVAVNTELFVAPPVPLERPDQIRVAVMSGIRSVARSIRCDQEREGWRATDRAGDEPQLVLGGLVMCTTLAVHRAWRRPNFVIANWFEVLPVRNRELTGLQARLGHRLLGWLGGVLRRGHRTLVQHDGAEAAGT